jgi:hypothetical protein
VPKEMFAKSGIPNSDCSDDTDSEFHGSVGYTPNDRTLRKHVNKEINQEKTSRESERISCKKGQE